MTDSNSPNHWDLLGSTLGAAPPPEEQEPRQPGPTPSQPSSPHKSASRASHHHRPAAAPRTADWDALAGELGLPPRRLRRPCHPAAGSNSGQTERGGAATAARTRAPSFPPPPETPEESPNFFDERFDFEEPFDLLESSESPAATAEDNGETAEPAEKRPRRRRRRRRRGRGDEQRESAAAGTDVGDRPADSTSASAEDSGRESEAELREPIGPQQVRDQSEAGRSRERRPQRHPPRRDRDRRDAGRGAAEERPRDRNRAAPPKLPEDDEVEVDVFADDELELGEGDQSEAEQPARLGFRGIPTWEEVLGMLIDKNLEARSKRPAGGPHHGRGNRGGRATTAADARRRQTAIVGCRRRLHCWGGS